MDGTVHALHLIAPSQIAAGRIESIQAGVESLALDYDGSSPLS
jgi:hypothetical protein